MNKTLFVESFESLLNLNNFQSFHIAYSHNNISNLNDIKGYIYLYYNNTFEMMPKDHCIFNETSIIWFQFDVDKGYLKPIA